MSLLKQIFIYIHNLDNKSFCLFSLCIITRVILQLIPMYYMNLAISGNKDSMSYAMKMYALTMMIKSIIIYFISVIENSILINIICEFIEDSYKKYSKLTFESKNQIPSFEFRQKMESSYIGIQNFLSVGIHSIINLLVCIAGTILIFIKHDKIWIIIVYIFINTIFYFVVTKKLQLKLSNYKTKMIKQRNETQCMINSKLPWLEANNDEVNNLIKLDCAIIRMYSYMDGLFSLIGGITSFINNLPYIIIIMDSSLTVTYFLLIIKLFGNVSSSIQRCNGFINNYNSQKIKFESFQEMWSDKSFDYDDILDLPVPNELIIKEINIPIGETKLVGNNIIIKQGSQILIRGASGTGKTTFINGLFGKIKGVTLNENNPKNYYFRAVEFYQNIKEKIPTSKITVRQLFFDEPNDKIIKKCLKMAQVNDWISNFDIMINNKISGGQKTRLAIATRLYQLITNLETKQIFVVDEPEQGSDPDVAYKIISTIKKYCREHFVTLLIISHLEQLENGQWSWDKVITIKKTNGANTLTLS